MADASCFAQARTYTPAVTVEYRGALLPAHFGDLAAEYEAGRLHVAVFDRSDRGRIVASGGDRKRWVNGLVTNAVSTLDDDSGNYAYAIDAKGRTLFDLNILSLPDALWLDLDRSSVASAAKHLDRYLLGDAVQLQDMSESDARLAVCGPDAGRAAAAIGITNFAALPALAHRPIAGGSARFVRHDFAGSPGFDLIVPRAEAAQWWDRVAELGPRPAGLDALDVLRIEAGIPWLGRDIDERILPPETGQIERGISYAKGCYVGYEILERMRSRGALARRLVRLSLPATAGVAELSPIHQGGAEVGRLTSLARHPKRDECVALGYLKTSLTSFVGLTAGDPPQAVRVVT